MTASATPASARELRSRLAFVRVLARAAARSVLLAVVLLAAALAVEVAAQPLVPAPPHAGERVTSAEIEQLVRQLEDPAARAEIVGKLKALQAVADRPAGGPEAADDALDKLSRLFLERLDVLVRGFAGLGGLLADLPLLGEWLSFQLENEFRRDLWRNVTSGVAQALGAGGLAAWLIARLVRRYRPSGPLGPGARLRAAALDLVPATVFALVSGLVLDLGGFLPATARVAWLIVAAVLVDRLLTVAGRHLVAASARSASSEERGPDSPTALLGSALLNARLVIYGNMALQVAGRLGLPPDLYDVGSTLLVAMLALTLSTAILARRAALERGVRSLGRWIETDFLRRLLLLDLLGGTAHLWLVGLVWLNAALLVLGAGWGPMRATLATLAVLLLAHLALTWLDRPSGSPPAPGDGEEPGERAQQVEPSLGRRLLKAAVKALAVVLLLEAWGSGLVGWLASPAGRVALDKTLRIAVILGVCFLLWRASSWWIGGYIGARDAQGNVRYSNRTRTAAAIAKSVIVVLLLLIAVTTTLGELGIQTAPLLAGAGVVGLAVGFGSQKLVQDIINGLFILLGDTIRVGDVVDLGGRTGVVEAISMRTVTLRAYNGDVHTIPFGTIDSITNMTRDFSYCVLDVTVAYRENVDAVTSVLHEIEGQMRREWPWRRLVLEPLEMAGLDRLGDSGVVIRARIKVRPGEQWRVGRELNRRIKRRFDELGIEFPFPQRTVHLIQEPGPGATVGLAAVEAAAPAQGRAVAGRG